MNKKIRILIFDHGSFNCLYLEKIFNSLGYYRIVPISKYEELMVIIECSVEPIDLVCYNFLDFKEHNDTDFFLRNNARINCLMSYNEFDMFSGAGDYQSSMRRETTHSFLPNVFSVADQMKAIESMLQNKSK